MAGADGARIDEAWLKGALDRARSARWADLRPAEQLQERLHAWAEQFAAARDDVASATLTLPRIGLHPDEATSFLRALDTGMVTVDPAGFVTVACVRRKQPPGRYALLCKSGAGVGVNLEYLIQIGATAELVADLGWLPADLDFERGEFDALGFDSSSGRVTLAMEAKARVDGPDGLDRLVRAWLSFQELGSVAEVPATNAGRKYRELHRRCAEGPVTVWLVAAGARWTLTAAMDGHGQLKLTGSPDAAPTQSGGQTGGRTVLWVRPFDPALHRKGSHGRRGQCSWLCVEPAEVSVRVRELGGTESTFALCHAHLDRVETVYQ